MGEELCGAVDNALLIGGLVLKWMGKLKFRFQR
jgi:hypothetical protein